MRTEVVDVGSLIVAGRPKEGSERGIEAGGRRGEEWRGLASLGRGDGGMCPPSPGLWRERGRGARPGAEGRTGSGTPAVWDK